MVIIDIIVSFINNDVDEVRKGYIELGYIFFVVVKYGIIYVVILWNNWYCFVYIKLCLLYNIIVK